MNRSVRTGVLAAAAVATLSGLAGCGGSTPAPTPLTRTDPTHQVAPAAQHPAPRRVGKPERIVIPAIGVKEKLYGVGLKADGAMQTPNFGDAGWYDLGPRPGAPGAAVVVAHVHGPAGDDVFARLHELEPGDRVRIRDSRGHSVFVVDRVDEVAKEALPYRRIWKHTKRRLLRLITCGGTPNPVTRMYPDNTIVYAHLVASKG